MGQMGLSRHTKMPQTSKLKGRIILYNSNETPSIDKYGYGYDSKWLTPKIGWFVLRIMIFVGPCSARVYSFGSKVWSFFIISYRQPTNVINVLDVPPTCQCQSVTRTVLFCFSKDFSNPQALHVLWWCHILIGSSYLPSIIPSIIGPRQEAPRFRLTPKEAPYIALAGEEPSGISICKRPN